MGAAATSGINSPRAMGADETSKKPARRLQIFAEAVEGGDLKTVLDNKECDPETQQLLMIALSGFFFLEQDSRDNSKLDMMLKAMDREELLRRFDWQSPLDPTIAFCEAKEARRLEPALTGPFDSAIHYPSEGHVFAPRLVKALLGALSRRSIPLDQGITVSKVAPTGSGTFTLTDRAGGTWEAEKVVLAAGSLLSSILLPPPEIRITPVNGQILAVRSPGSYYRKVVFYPPHGYFVPKMDGTVVIGATEEKIGTRTRVTPAGLMEFLAPLSELSPDILALPLHHTWSGLRPRSDDGFPVMGPHPECPGLFFAAGHYRNGILLAPVTGQILADAIEGRISDAVRPFLPDRLTAASFS